MRVHALVCVCVCACVRNKGICIQDVCMHVCASGHLPKQPYTSAQHKRKETVTQANLARLNLLYCVSVICFTVCLQSHWCNEINCVVVSYGAGERCRGN